MNQDLLNTIQDYIPSDMMNMLNTNNIQKSMKGKSLKERRELANNMLSIKNAITTASNSKKKYHILITSSRKIKRILVNDIDTYIPQASLVEKKCSFNLLTGIKTSTSSVAKEDQDILDALDSNEDETNIYVMYDEKNKNINRRATKILGYAVGGNVLFYNKYYDLEIKDIPE